MLRRWAPKAGAPMAYAAVSAFACAIDFAVTTACAGTAPALAATSGYLCGLAAHWILSTRLVFTGASAISGAARYRRKALYLLSGLAGLIVTVCVYTVLCGVGAAPALAKASAVAASFGVTYVWRRYFIFSRLESAPAC